MAEFPDMSNNTDQSVVEATRLLPISKQSVLTPEIRNLGRKTRERLQEERDKRHEIIRINAIAAPPLQSTNQNKKDATNSKLAAPFLLLNPKKPLPTRSTGLKRQRRSSSAILNKDSNDSKTDLWLPDVSHLIVVDKDEVVNSKAVMLHGLPVHIKPSAIRKLLNGLEPYRLLILLQPDKNNQTLHTPALDANHNVPRSKEATRNSKPSNKSQQLIVDRYSTEELRVIVSFSTAAAAALAVQRSGEFVCVTTYQTATATITDAPVSAAIAVTHLPIKQAEYLVNNLAMDAHPNETLTETLTRVQNELHPSVAKILWSDAIRQLNLEIKDWDKQVDNNILQSPTDSVPHALKDLTVYQQVEDYRKRLLALKVEIEGQLPYPSAKVLDPSVMLRDSVVYLSSRACAVLEATARRIEQDIIIPVFRWKIFRHVNNPYRLPPLTD